MEKYIIDQEVVWERFKDDLFSGYAPVKPAIEKKKPWLCYIGPRIPLTEWRTILAFFKWSHEEKKCETQVRLYFNKEKGLWRAWAFPQEKGTSGSTSEIDNLCDDERKKADLGKGWLECGTVHHHSSMTAFQSGTDRNNEATKNGIHITVGKMGDANYDLHGRLSFRAAFYDIDWSDWFEIPAELAGIYNLSAKLQKEVMEFILSRGVTEKDTFPDAWKENVIQRYSYQGAQKEWTPGMTHHVSQGNGTNDQLPWETRQEALEKERNQHTSPGPKVSLRITPGKSGKPLTKKERRALRKLVERAGEEDFPQGVGEQASGHNLSDFYTDDEKLKLNRASMAIVQACAAMGIEVSEAFQLIQREPTHCSPEELMVVDHIDEVLTKEGLWPENVKAWIDHLALEGETSIDVVSG